MPTPKKGPHLASSPTHERPMLADMATSLFQNGRITITLPKVKRPRSLAERLIISTKRGDPHSRRRVMRVIRNKSVVHILLTQIAEQMEQHEGGCIRTVKIASRVGDVAPAVMTEPVTESAIKKAVMEEAEVAAKVVEEEAPAVEAEAIEAAEAAEAPVEEAATAEAEAPVEEVADAEEAE